MSAVGTGRQAADGEASCRRDSALSKALPPPDPDRPWIAEIAWEAGPDGGRFLAIARRGTDSAVVAESMALDWPTTEPAPRDRKGAVTQLEHALLNAGWKAIEPGPIWRTKRFRWPSAGEPTEARSAAPCLADPAGAPSVNSHEMTAPLATQPATRVSVSIAALVAAEILLALGHALAAQLADAVLAVLLVNAGRRADDGPLDRVDPTVAALRALAVVALTRVVGLALPVHEMGERATQCVLAGTIAVTALQLAPLVGVNRWSLLTLPPLRFAWGTALGGLALGLGAYLIGAPALWSPGDGPLLVVGAVTTAAMTAVAEEIVFRGLVQLTLWRLAKGLGVLLATGLFASTYLGFGSLSLLLLAALAGLLFAEAVVRTGVVGSALAGHVLFAVGAAVAWPAVLGAEPPITLPEAPTGIALTAAVVLGALQLVKSASSIENDG